jgi:hypothetical protein
VQRPARDDVRELAVRQGARDHTMRGDGVHTGTDDLLCVLFEGLKREGQCLLLSA